MWKARHSTIHVSTLALTTPFGFWCAATETAQHKLCTASASWHVPPAVPPHAPKRITCADVTYPKQQISEAVFE